jgi:hypothetical protein
VDLFHVATFAFAIFLFMEVARAQGPLHVATGPLGKTAAAHDLLSRPSLWIHSHTRCPAARRPSQRPIQPPASGITRGECRHFPPNVKRSGACLPVCVSSFQFASLQSPGSAACGLPKYYLRSSGRSDSDRRGGIGHCFYYYYYKCY